MRKILIAHNYSEVSYSVMSFHLANYLANLGYEVYFISHQPYFKEPEIIPIGPGKILVTSWCSQKRPTGWRDYIWFAKFYLKYKPEIIGHFVGSNISIMLSKFFSLGKVRTFEYYHTLSSQILEDTHHKFLKQKFLFYRKKMFYNYFCDLIICPSDKAKSDLKSYYNIEKSITILNPMVDRFVTKKLISKDKIIISYLGRLDRSKGIVELIDAFEIFKSTNPSSKILLNIAGTGKLSNFIEEKSKLNSALSFYKSIEYLEVDQYLNSSNYVIIPSKSDNLPTVGLEALMNQTPLLISSQTGLADYLIDGESCVKFDPNVKSIIEVFQLVEANTHLNKQMSVEARNTFLEKFSIKNYCENIIKLI